MKITSKKKLKSPRCSPQKVISDGGFEPFEALAAGIVAQAITDARIVQRGVEIHNAGSPVNETELIKFFEGKWCAMLLSTTNLTGQEIRERVMAC